MKRSADGIIHADQAKYLEHILPERDEVARALEENASRNDVPIVDPEVGRFLQLAALSVGARRVLEIGTATGYSGLHFLRALAADGELVTIDVDAERQRTARDYWRQAGLADQARLVLGPALEVIPTLAPPFDLVFLDAIKLEYQRYLDLALPLLRRGGLVVADNVLWGGDVARGVQDEDVNGLRAFNDYAMRHPQLLSVILPLGDGLLYAVKTEDE